MNVLLLFHQTVLKDVDSVNSAKPAADAHTGTHAPALSQGKHGEIKKHLV